MMIMLQAVVRFVHALAVLTPQLHEAHNASTERQGSIVDKPTV